MEVNFNEILKNQFNPYWTLKDNNFVIYRLFKTIKINDKYSLSIQASPFHDCSKKDKLYEPNEYDDFEIAILERITYEDMLLDENVINFKELKIMQEFERYNELCECEIEDNSIKNVPKDLVADLYKYLIKK